MDTIESAIKKLVRAMDEEIASAVRKNGVEYVIQALREKLERENSPKPVPLTVEQLREMDKEPIWVVYKGDEYSEAQSHWCFVSGGDVYPCDWQTVNDYTYPLNGFGTADTDLCAYTTKPETEGRN